VSSTWRKSQLAGRSIYSQANAVFLTGGAIVEIWGDLQIEKIRSEAISRRKALSITGPELRVGFTDSVSRV
jgi:hypothetical protein